MKNKKTNILTGLWVSFFLLLIVHLLTAGIALFYFLILATLLFIGLGISILTLNEIVKSKDSIKSKIYFNFIFNLLIFGSIGYFYFASIFLAVFSPAIFSSIDAEGFGMLLFVIPSTLIAWIIMFIAGLVLIRKYKDEKEPLYLKHNLNKLSRFYTFVVVVVISLSFLVVGVMATFSRLSPPDNPREVVDRGLNCDDFGFNVQDLSSCYLFEAYKTGDPSLCLKGIKKSLPDMENCIINAADKSNNISICEYFVNDTFSNQIDSNNNQSDKDTEITEGIIMQDDAIDYERCLRSTER